MKKAYVFMLAAAAALAATGYVAIGVDKDGGGAVPSACRVVGAEVVLSTNQSASATLSVVKHATREWDETTVTTNVTVTRENVVRSYTATNVETHVVLSDGFKYVAVNVPLTVSTNYVGVGTNVLSVATNSVAFYTVTNDVQLTWNVSTNMWFFPAVERSVVVTTNRTPVVSTTHHAYTFVVTNSLFSVSCSGGYGSTNVTNGAFLNSGDRIVGGGNAFDKAPKVTVFAE